MKLVYPRITSYTYCYIWFWLLIPYGRWHNQNSLTASDRNPTQMSLCQKGKVLQLQKRKRVASFSLLLSVCAGMCYHLHISLCCSLLFPIIYRIFSYKPGNIAVSNPRLISMARKQESFLSTSNSRDVQKELWFLYPKPEV